MISQINSKSLDFYRFVSSLSASLCPTGPRQHPDFLNMSSGNSGGYLCVNLREECACSKEGFGSVRSRLCAKDLLLYNKGGPLICRHSLHWCQQKLHIEFKCALFASNSSQGLPYFNIYNFELNEIGMDFQRCWLQIHADERWENTCRSMDKSKTCLSKLPVQLFVKRPQTRELPRATECQILAWRVLASFHLLLQRHADFHQLKIKF